MPGIHVFATFCKTKGVDGRDKPGYDVDMSALI
jgi:hypothetical protein